MFLMPGHSRSTGKVRLLVVIGKALQQSVLRGDHFVVHEVVDRAAVAFLRDPLLTGAMIDR